MEIDARISILGNGDGVVIKVYDELSGVNFVQVEMTPQQFVDAALGRLGRCEPRRTIVAGLEKVGKFVIHKPLEFECDFEGVEWKDRKGYAGEVAMLARPDGWEVSTYFGSQDSFFQKDGRDYARTTIRKWVEPDSEEAFEFKRVRSEQGGYCKHG